jgi:cell division protein FtsQ
VKPRPPKRVRNRKRPDWLRILLSLSLLALGVETIQVAFNSPRLAVKKVSVEGAKTLPAAHVAELTGVPIGRNIFRTNLYRARLAVQQEPVIHHATISRLLPDTVVVSVYERTPAFTLDLGTRLYEVDASGMIYRSLTTPLPKLPVLCVGDEASWQIGKKLPPAVLAPASECIRLATAARLSLTKISVDAHHDLWLNISASGAGNPPKELRIRLGRPEELRLKFADAQRVLRGAPQVSDLAAYLDVSCAGRPAYMAQSSTGSSRRL